MVELIFMSESEDEFVCDVCGRIFPKKQSLTLHRMMHSDNCSTCDLCGRTFRCARSLRYHTTMIHNKDKRDDDNKVVCEECEKSFASRPGLKRHMLTHSKECVGSACNHCGAIFKSRRSLRAHIRMSHLTKYGSFQCSVCGKNCITEQALRQHMTVMHNQDVARRIADRRETRMHDHDFVEKMRRHAHETICTKESIEKRTKTLSKIVKTDKYRKSQREAQLKRYREHPEYKKLISDRMHAFFSSLDADGWVKWENEHNIRGRRSWETNKSGDSVFCASSYESSFCRSAKEDVSIADFHRCGVKIIYSMEGVDKVYFPDFSVDMVDGSRIVIETKDDRLVDDPVVVAKAKAASEFLSSEGIGYAIMTGVDLKRYSRNHNLRSTLSCVDD